MDRTNRYIEDEHSRKSVRIYEAEKRKGSACCNGPSKRSTRQARTRFTWQTLRRSGRRNGTLFRRRLVSELPTSVDHSWERDVRFTRWRSRRFESPPTCQIVP